MSVSLSEHFNYKKLFKAVLPSVFMMFFTSIYSIVDGFFVSNFVSTTAFASLNLMIPVIMILASVGFMMGAGGSALVAKTLGEGDRDKANSIFSMVVVFNFIIGLILSIVCCVFIEEIVIALGATQEMISDCVSYGRTIIAFIFLYTAQNCFQSMFVVAERPTFGFAIMVIAGVTNIVLDALFIIVFNWGIFGSALATGISYLVGTAIPVFYFLSKRNTSLLKFVKFKFNFKAIGFSALNGSSELVTNIALSITSIFYNLQLLKLAGENGVAAYGAIMYAGFIFAAIFIGYSIGSAPIISFNFGAKNHSELKNILQKSLRILTISGIIMFIFTEIFAMPLSFIFVGKNQEILSLATSGMRIYSISFLVVGINIFASAFFTALNNGLISAVISFLRTLVFEILCVMILPIFFKLNGVWFSCVVAELLAILVSIICLVACRKKYHY